jgi:hypothetical protein
LQGLGRGLAKDRRPLDVDDIFTLMEGLRSDGIPILPVEQNMSARWCSASTSK